MYISTASEVRQVDCFKEETLLALLEGTLSPADKAAADEHLAGCERCIKLVALSANATGNDQRITPAEGGPSPGPGSRIGRFEIEGPIGAGGMGVVYSARDPQLGRRVALKLLRPGDFADSSGRERALAEARAMARLSHPNVVAIYEVGSLGDELFIAMELVVGRTLRAWLESGERSWREILVMFLAAGRGLAAAHAAGLVHRDFKPDNVLVGDDGRVLITDFGLARLGGAEASGSTPSQSAGNLAQGASPLTPPGALLGTPAYMAPEQLDGAGATAASDQFAFCTSLFEALAGQRPYAGQTALAMRAAIRAGDRVAASAAAAALASARARARTARRIHGSAGRRWPRCSKRSRPGSPDASGCSADSRSRRCCWRSAPLFSRAGCAPRRPSTGSARWRSSKRASPRRSRTPAGSLRARRAARRSGRCRSTPARAPGRAGPTRPARSRARGARSHRERGQLCRGAARRGSPGRR